MRSLYTAVVLTMLATLSLSLLAFFAISKHYEKQYLYPVLDAMDRLELDSAREALDEKGTRGLSTYLARLDQAFGPSHYVLNSDGTDVLSGERHTDLLPAAPATASRGRLNGQFVVTRRSPDRRYWLVAIDSRQSSPWTLLPYYALVVVVTAVWGWLAVVGVVSPIRTVTESTERFGRGDLAARANLQRKDEIGALAASFDSMAERLQTLVASERRLLQDISHELRSPLTRLKLAVHLTRTAPDPAAALDRVERETNRITLLVSEIVEMTRMEGDPQARRMAAVDFGEIVRETLDDCRVEAQLLRACSLSVQGELHGEVSGDHELLRRAVENVLRNAIRYSPEDSNIDVQLAEDSSGASITIRDYGPGVPNESLAQIFEPFVRVEEARDGDSGGVGLGLSIAKRAIRLHRGTIVAENAEPGLRVRITVPAWVPRIAYPA
jgi:signal transduction histidine kinase